MRHKDLPYYYHSAWLRFWAVVYRFKSKNQDLENLISLQDLQFEWNYQSQYYSLNHLADLHVLKASLKFDAHGIALTNRDVRDNNINPLFPALWALANWNAYKTEAKSSIIDDFLKNSEQLIKESESKDFGRILFYHGRHSRYPTFDLWYSGITQALAASTMIRCFEYTSDPTFLEYAKEFLNACLNPVEKQGVLVNSRFGKWIEEYPGSECPLVLNGFIFALIALMEYDSVAEDKLFTPWIALFLQTLVRSLPYYIFPKGIKYCLQQQKLSNIEYQALYISQFDHLYQLSAHPLFAEIQDQLNERIDWKRFHSFYRPNE